MAAAIAAAAGVSALGAIAQYYQSEKARKASEQRLDEIAAMFDAIKPPEYDVTVNDPPKYITETVPEPAVNYSALKPEQFKLLGEFKPEIAAYVAEKAPEVVTKTEAAKSGRDAQLDALRQLKARSQSTGVDPEMQTLMDQANRSAQQASQSRNQSIMQDAQRRGQLGSGLMLAGQLQASSDAMQRAADADQNAALEAYRQKLAALRDSASLGGQISNQEFQESSRNADIINAFNQRTARGQQDYNQYRAGLMNDAQRSNLDAAQRIADRNTELGNQFMVSNRNMANQGAVDNYNRALNERAFQNTMADRSYRNQLEKQDRYNKMQSQQYGDKIAQGERKAGMASQYNQLDYQRAQDMNNMIQGATNAGVAGIGAYQNQQAANKAQIAADDRSYYNKTGRYMNDDELQQRRNRYDEY